MATCKCGAELPKRRRRCDACKAETRRLAMARRAERRAAAPPDSIAVLSHRGTQLWTALAQAPDTAAGQLALEACRIADRLNELDAIITGRGVLDLMRFRLNPDWWDEDDNHHVNVTVTFQSVLAEARQQATTFKALLVDLAKVQGAAAAPAAAGGPPAGQPAAPVSALDQLEQKRRSRGT